MVTMTRPEVRGGVAHLGCHRWRSEAGVQHTGSPTTGVMRHAGPMGAWARRGVAVLLMLVGLSGCPEPKLTVANSAQAAEACRDVIRAERDDPSVELLDPNRTSIDGDIVTATYLVEGSEVTTACRFTFDRETQSYAVSDSGMSAARG
jgi:hypothetical protein